MNESRITPSGYPRRALRAALFLIFVQCVMLAYPPGNWLVTGGLAIWAISRWWTIRSGWVIQTPVIWNALFLLVVFVLKHWVWPETFPSDAGFSNTVLAHEIGCWLVTVQILILHEPASLKRVPPLLAALACGAILCAGDIQLHSLSRRLMLILMILFVGGLGWFAHAGRNWIPIDPRRRLRRCIMLSVFALAAVPTVIVARVWHQNERQLETLLVQLMRMLDGNRNSSRMRGRSALANVSNGRIYDPERPVLRIQQDSPEPSYLRGTTYGEYPFRVNPAATRPLRQRREERLVRIKPREVGPDQGFDEFEELFEIFPTRSNQWNQLSIEYLSKEDPIPMAPLYTGMMRINVSELRIDADYNLAVSDYPLPDTLTCYIPSDPVKDEYPLLSDRNRELPSRLDPRIAEIARSIFEGQKTDTEKIRAVESFFHDNYLYQVGYEPEDVEDAVTNFILRRPAAHCEYFAMGAALLLRYGGLPTRYVTGYVPSERHPGGIWIARRKDAHAWAEAYDSNLKRWVTVEATPSNGLPERRAASWSNSMRESWRQWWSQFQGWNSLSSLWPNFGSVFQSTSVRIILGMLLVLSWWMFNRRYRRSAIVAQSQSSSREFQFQHWLRDLERQMQQHGLTRKPQETLLQFRERILSSPHSDPLRPAAEWFAEYSSIRYDETEHTSDRLSQLELSWRELFLDGKSGAERKTPF